MASIKDILLQVRGETRDAQSALDQAIDKLHKFDGTDAQARASVDLGDFDRHIAEAEALLDALDHKDVSVKVKLKVDDVRATLDDLKREAEQALSQPRSSGGTFLPFDKGAIERDLQTVRKDLGEVTQGFEEASSAGGNGGKIFDNLGLSFARLQPIIVGVAIALGVALVGSLSAVAASAAAAVGGLAALATAAAAMLGPAMLVLFAVMDRMSHVMAAFTQHQTAATDASQKAAQAHADNSAKVEALRAAHESLITALESEKRAERDLGDARLAAAKAIKDAQHQVKVDQQDVKNALADEKKQQENLKQTRADAYKAWHDAIQRVKDDELSLAQTRLDVESATLKVGDAQKTLNDLLNTIPSDKLAGVLDKLTNVNLDPAAAEKFIQAASGPGSDPALGEKIVKAQLAVAQAKLDLKKANNDVTKSEVELGRAQADNNRFTQEGIHAYQPYIDAIDRLHQSEQHLGDVMYKRAQDEAAYHKLQKAGVEGSRQVQNAELALTQAHRGAADARHRLAVASQAAAAGTKGLSAAQAKLGALMGQLDPVEQRFVKKLEAIDKLFTRLLRPGTDAFFKVFTKALEAADKGLRHFAPLLNTLAKAMADQLGAFLKELERPSWQKFFGQMIKFATQAVKIMGPGFIDLARIFRNIALDAAPALLQILRWIVKGLDSLAKTSGTKEFKAFIGLLVDSFKTWLKLIVPIGKIFLSFLKAAAPFGNELVKWLAKGLEHLAGWMNSRKGLHEMQMFFEATAPLLKAVVPLLGQIALLFLQLNEILAPFLTGFIKGLTAMVKLVNFFAGVIFDKLIYPFRKFWEVLGLVASFMVGGFGLKTGFKIASKAVEEGLGAIENFFAKAFSAKTARAIARWGTGMITGLFSAIIGFLVGGGDLIASGFKAAWKAVTKFFSQAPIDIIKQITDGLVAAEKWAARAIENAGKFIATKLVDGIGSFFAEGAKIAGDIISGIASFVAKFQLAATTLTGWLQDGIVGFYTLGKKVAQDLIDGIVALTSALVGVGKDVAGWIIGQVVGFYDLGKSVMGDLERGVRDVAGTVVQLGKDILGWIVSPITGFYDLGKGAAGELVHGFRDVADGLKNLGGDIAGWIIGQVRGFYNEGVASAGELIGGIRSIASGLAKLGSDIANWILGGISGFYTQGVQVVQGIISGITSGLKTAGKGLQALGVQIGHTLRAGLQHVGGFIAEGAGFVNDIIHGISHEIGRLWGWGKNIADKVIGAVKHFLGISSPSKAFIEIGGHIIDGLVQGLDFGKVMEFAKASLGGLKSLILHLFKSGLLAVTPGNIIKAAKWLGESAFDVAKSVGGDALKFAGNLSHKVEHVIGGGLHDIGKLFGLASGGLVTGPITAMVGEGAFNEAVLPLSRSVYDQLAAGITRSLTSVGGPVAPQGFERMAQNITQNFNLLMPDTGNGQPDVRRTGMDLAREARSRNGFFPGSR